jgi:peptide/nickel transport system permease protein
MGSYTIRRLLLTIPTVFLVTIIVFFMIRLIPGDIVDIMVSQQSMSITPVDRAAIAHALGMDVPVMTQYGRWIGGILLHGDLGNSLWKRSPIINDIKARWPVTFELGFLAILVSQAIALPIGIYSAIRQDSIGDVIARSFAVLCMGIPSFWLAIMVIVFPSIWWGYMPSIWLISFTKDPIGNLAMFIVPAIILGIGMAGSTMRMTRTMMLDVLKQDYIRTAWAKGLKERSVVVRHALKNALIPIVTLIGFQLPVLVGGTVIIENIFSLPGMGQLMLNATQQRDYTTVEAVLFVSAFIMVIINILVDLTYGFLDPRVHYQ